MPFCQSTRHIMLIEPLDFYGNPETMETNVYQTDTTEDHGTIQRKALAEFRAFRDKLVENGVHVTVARGYPHCPDQIFPNWLSTHADGRMVLYPMYNESRRRERAADMIALLNKTYPTVVDLRPWENAEKMIESTGSMVLDHVHRIAYAGLSKRTRAEAVREWGAIMGYEPVIFETQSHQAGLPIYHSDLVINIGTTFAMVAADTITEPYRQTVVDSLSAHRAVIILTPAQQKSFCGNALEVLGEDDKRMLVMSDTAFFALRQDQKDTLLQHVDRIIHAPLPTIELYGGGSARCLMLELF